MKKNYLLTIMSLLFCFVLQAQVSYSGNGNSGFGGTLGGSTLNISDDGTTMTFSFSRGGSNIDNVIVIYVDSKTGGFSDTTTFNDNTAVDRVAISTTNGPRDPEVTFPSGFTADYAISIKNDFAGIFELAATGSHNFIASADLTPNNNNAATTHTFTVDFSEIGISSTDKFDFVATYVSGDSWMSDEVIGDTSNITAGSGAGVNPGPDGSITFSDSRSYPNTWTGTTNSDWATATNWTEGVPSSTHNVYIPSVTNHPTAAAAVTINKGVIKSGASLIAQDAFTGTITYERNLPTSNWYLVSSPVSGQAYNNDYVTANGIASSVDNPTNRGIATYLTASNTWSYLQGGGSGTFNNGQGYSVKRTATGDVSFTGTINTTDVSVTVENTGTGFNLIGNPYTSHVNSATFLTDNSANLVSETLWVWNGSGYDTHISAVPFTLAPAQGFFVRSSNGTSLNFAELNQATSGGTFQKSAKTEVKLMMNDGTFDRFAKMYFLDNVTKGFDNGFDGETFGGIENSVDIFTNLLADNEGKKFQIQSLPISEMETMIIPVGIKAEAGKEITFTAEAMNLPSDLKVFLEDRTANTVTRLDEANSEYKVTLSEASNGTGRFYLHTKASSVLSTADVTLKNISLFATNHGTLKIVGLPSGKSNLKLYNILGKQVMQTTFTSTGAQEISLPKLSTGVYFVQLESGAGKLNKKIILD